MRSGRGVARAVAAGVVVAGGWAVWDATLGSAAPACTTTWADPAGGAWHDPSRWSNGLPDGDDHACLPDLGDPYTVQVLFGTTVGGITVEEDATLAVTSNTTGGNVELHLAPGGTDLLNAGTVELTSAANQYALLDLNGNLLDNDGTFRSATGSGQNVRFFRDGNVQNDGTIEIDHNLTTDAGAGVITNDGTIDVAPGRQWHTSALSVVLDSGSVEGGGQLLVSNNLTWNGGDVADGTDLRNRGGTLTMAADGEGTVTADGAGFLVGTIGADKVVRVESNTSAGQAERALTADTTNLGTVELLSAANAHVVFSLQDHTLTNDGTFRSAAGSGQASRFFRGGVGSELVNNGTVEVDFNLSTDIGSGSITNNGTIDVALARIWHVQTMAVELASGSSVTGTGELLVQNDLDWNGGDVDAGVVVRNRANTLTSSGTGSGTVIADGGGALAGAIGEDETVVLESNSAIGQAERALFGDVTNEGTIELTSAANAHVILSLGANTLVNEGTIRSSAGTGQALRFLRVGVGGALDNTGTVDVDFDLQSDINGGGTLTNRAGGVVDVAVGKTWNVTAFAVTLEAGSDVLGGGTLHVANNLTWDGGTIAGGTTVRQSHNAFNSTGTGEGTVILHGGGTIGAGTIGEDETVLIEGTSAVGSGERTLTGDVTNDGTVGLTVSANAHSLLVLGANTFTNNGTFESLPGSGQATRFLRAAGGTFDNAGTVDVDFPLQSDLGSGTLTISGTIDVAENQAWNVSIFSTTLEPGSSTQGAGSLNVSNDLAWNGGDIAVGTTVRIIHNDLTFGGAGTGTLVANGVGTLTGTIASGQTVVLRGGDGQGSAERTLAADTTNNGTIELTVNANAHALLSLGEHTLTNAGTFRSAAGSGQGTRFLRSAAGGALTNTGTIDVDFSMQSDVGTAVVTNEGGVIDIASGAAWNVQAEWNFAFDGGSGAGTGALNITSGDVSGTGDFGFALNLGTDNQLAIGGGGTGTLAVGAASFANGVDTFVDIGSTGHDLFAVTGNLARDGDVLVDFGDFVPPVCSAYQIMAWGSASGAFDSVVIPPVADRQITAVTTADGLYVAVGLTGSNIVLGTDDGELLNGTAGPDTIIALDGDDTVEAGGGFDVVCGGDGNDTIDGGAGGGLLGGGAGNDSIAAGANASWLFGEAGNDTLLGGPEGDILLGGDDDDDLFGNDGADYLSGQKGDDFHDGGDGGDTIYGGTGVNVIHGGDGDDDIHAGNGNDTVLAGPGDDTVRGGKGRDDIDGGPGLDDLRGGGGGDTLHGGTEDDDLDGGPGNDTCDGGTGGEILGDEAVNCEATSNLEALA